MTRLTQSHSHSHTHTHSPAPSDPYTNRFLPLKDWPDQTNKARDWMAEEDEHGISNRIKMEDRACIRAGRNVSERWSDDDLEYHTAMEAFYEFKMGCPKDLTLPIPQRGDTYGYSWTAWCQAAQTAGARRRPFSLKECIQVVNSCVEYWHSQIIEWRDHPEILTTHIREFCQPILDACLLSEDLLVIMHPHTMMLNRRVRDVFEGYCYWLRIKKSFDTLVHLGLEEGGKTATLQVLTPGPIQDEYANLQRIVSHVEKMSEKALQMDFAMGRGRIYVEPCNNTSFLTRFDQYTEGDLFCLTQPIEHLRKTSYLDYLLAGMSRTYGREDKTKRGFWHFLLEYEQELPRHPDWAKKLGSHMQRLIGEASMISDVIATTAWITKEGDYIKKSADIDWYTEMKPQIDMIYKIFIYRTPAIVELEYNYLLQDDLGERLMKQWYQYSRMIYNKDLDELFNLNDKVDRWISTRVDAILVVDGMAQMSLGDDGNSGKLDQSGHSYSRSRSNGNSPNNKIKTRPEMSDIMASVDDGDLTHLKNTYAEGYTNQIFKVNNKQMKLVRRLFSSASDSDGQGQVKWDDVYKLMKRIGFRVEDVGGSIIRFVPPNEAGIPFNEHRPHPEVSLHAIRYRAFGERLKRRYGWSIDWFERVPQAV